MVASASANSRLPVVSVDTSTDPAIAVPSDDPRFEILRDKPEISPWSFSGNADCTTLTEAVSMTPDTDAHQEQAGHEGPDARRGPGEKQ